MFFILGVVLVLLIVLYLYGSWNYDYWKKHGIPYEKPTLFFGNIRESLLGRKHLGIIYNEIYKKFPDAAYVGVFTLRTPSLLLRDLDIIKDVLVKEYSSFEDNAFETGFQYDPILTVNPFFHSGEEWKKRRSQWSTNLTLSKVKFLYEFMDQKQKLMVEYLKQHVEEQPGEPLEARKLALRYLTDVMVHGTMGLKSDAFKDDNNVFKRIAESLFMSSFIDNFGITAYMIAPWLHHILPIGWVKPWVVKELDAISDKIVSTRKEQGFLQNDFFESLMKDETVEMKEVGGRVFGFLSEGVETSSGLISFTLFELASNPQIQAKLRNELNALANANGGKLSYDDIASCKYFDMVLNETMRLYPAVLTMIRVCTKSFTLPPAIPGGEAFTVPVGTGVTICNYATHKDPQYFPDPETFDPERFAEGNDVPRFAYLPFGEGPRICVGMKLGITNAKTAIASIIRNFEIRVSPKTHKRPLTIDPNVLVSRAVGELWITLHQIVKD